MFLQRWLPVGSLMTFSYSYNTIMHTRSLFSAILPSARDLIPNGKMAKENTKTLKSVVTVNAWRKGCYHSIKYNLYGKSSWHVKLTANKTAFQWRRYHKKSTSVSKAMHSLSKKDKTHPVFSLAAWAGKMGLLIFHPNRYFLHCTSQP